MRSYNVQIFCGLKERDTGLEHSIEEVYEICQEYCDKVGSCVTVTPTRYIYTNGFEDGVIVGLIQYPRFPIEERKIWVKAYEIAYTLMIKLNQYRVTIMSFDEVKMLSNPNLLND